MKNQNLVNIIFTYGDIKYTAVVYKHRSTAIELPNKTVLATETVVHQSGPRRNMESLCSKREIFDFYGNLLPLKLIRKPGGWSVPLQTRLPIAKATPI